MLAIHHNFCRVHQTLRITPAMQDGLSIYATGNSAVTMPAFSAAFSLATIVATATSMDITNSREGVPIA